MSKRIIVTGSAGFIGYHLCQRLLKDGYTVIGIDNLTDYYDPGLKEDRLSILREWSDFSFYKTDLSNKEDLESVFSGESVGKDDRIVNLAAQPGVRYALENPDSYIQSNLIGFYNLIDLARRVNCKHMLYASSSSVYGGNTRLPFSIQDNVDHPISLYAATKKSNELLAHSYSYTYNLPTTGLRFFTVYGPWGRPDMAYFIFTKAILSGKSLPVFNQGDMSRDFTYIDDVVEGIVRLLPYDPLPDPNWDGNNPKPGSSWVPYRIYNIGNHESVNLLDFIRIIEDSLGKKAKLEMQPMQIGDVKDTYADIEDLASAVGFSPSTPIQDGIPRFIEWYLDYYKVSV
ncbi:MAG: NAD-dependent epimerase [Candidatus Electryonea clarkiae]|nr:NAD-dependent epimerase [Candidatus Electryonea clarkiae]MDP8289160.1 NAD-dependent epimerase [Candidatus Electryonea clarkiae]